MSNRNAIPQSHKKKDGDASACSPVAINTKFPSLPSLESYGRAPILVFKITKDGDVADVRLERSSGSDAIDSALISGIKKWKYKPPPCGPVEERMRVSINLTAIQ
jgi:TonB family protein